MTRRLTIRSQFAFCSVAQLRLSGPQVILGSVSRSWAGSRRRIEGIEEVVKDEL
jgi:hypothetical protein